jgi:two-component system, LuxR family, response regulator FixJ
MPWNTALPIFIADDDADTRDALRFMLTCEGYRVRTFASGRDLLGAAAVDEPCLIILDYLMPGMNGLEVYRELRARDVRMPVILITGHPDPSIRRRALEAGLAVIDKPGAQALLSAIETVSSS